MRKEEGELSGRQLSERTRSAKENRGCRTDNNRFEQRLGEEQAAGESGQVTVRRGTGGRRVG